MKLGSQLLFARGRFIQFIFLFISIVLSIKSLPAENIFSVDNTKRFADHLYQQRDYEGAAQEYLRLLFFSPGDDSIRYKIALCYEHSMIHPREMADSIYEDLATYSKDPNIALKSKLRLALIEFKGKNYSNSLDLLNNIDHSANLFKRDQRKEFLSFHSSLVIGDLLMMEKYNKALRKIEMIQQDDDPECLQEYRESLSLYKKGVQLKSKKPWLSLLLSTVVPGLGKIYSDRMSDGIVSMVSVYLSCWLADRAFQRGGLDSTSGWLFTSIGAALYSGNIYGSYVAAKIYNETYQKQYNYDVKSWIDNKASRCIW
jgi:hypothetical protein